MSITKVKPESAQELFDYCDEAIACVRVLVDRGEMDSDIGRAINNHFLDARIIISEIAIKASS